MSVCEKCWAEAHRRYRNDPDKSPAPTGEADRRERCKTCFRIYGFAWTVPDDVWARVMGETQRVACLDCFDAVAYAKGVEYQQGLELHGYVGRRDAEVAIARWDARDALRARDGAPKET